MESKFAFAFTVRANRLALGWSQEDLAERLHEEFVGNLECETAFKIKADCLQLVSDFESGRRKPTELEVIVLANILEIPVEALLDAVACDEKQQ